MNDSGFVDTKLYLSSFYFFDSFTHLKCHGPNFWIRHQSPRPQHFTELAHSAHHVRSSHHSFKIHPAALNLLNHIFATNNISASILRFFLLLPSCNYQNTGATAKAMWQNNGTAYHLISMFRIYTKTHSDFDGFIEFGIPNLLYEGNRLLQLKRLFWYLLKSSSEFLISTLH